MKYGNVNLKIGRNPPFFIFGKPAQSAKSAPLHRRAERMVFVPILAVPKGGAI